MLLSVARQSSFVDLKLGKILADTAVSVAAMA
jgi:hypothetical protein